ncbi:MAG TPA: hypothetical protein VK453_24510 [Micromonosporaceae bacterium]|nr:hypothetical protein [Micromonosporaceae bacterium]
MLHSRLAVASSRRSRHTPTSRRCPRCRTTTPASAPVSEHGWCAQCSTGYRRLYAAILATRPAGRESVEVSIAHNHDEASWPS